MTTETKIEPFHPNGINRHLLNNVVACYQQVYAESPWHEWMKCLICKKSWGIKDKERLAQPPRLIST